MKFLAIAAIFALASAAPTSFLEPAPVPAAASNSTDAPDLLVWADYATLYGAGGASSRIIAPWTGETFQIGVLQPHASCTLSLLPYLLHVTKGADNARNPIRHFGNTKSRLCTLQILWLQRDRGRY